MVATSIQYVDLKASDWLFESTQLDWFDRLATKQDNLRGIDIATFKDLIDNLLPPHKGDKFNENQVLKLFQLFDTNNDHILDLKEFCAMCIHWLRSVFTPTNAFIIVDVQNDFISGSLALKNGPAQQEGKEVVPVINDILSKNKFNLVVYTHDWHPVDHIGFYENLHLRNYSKTKDQHSSNNNGSSSEDSSQLMMDAARSPSHQHDNQKANNKHNDISVFDTVYFNNGNIKQILWPRHCVQNSWGSQLDKDLIKVDNCINIYKGTLPEVDAYSVFWDNQRLNETKLARDLLSRHITDVYICGLAIDYCVSASAIDAAHYGFVTYVIQDACRGIDNVSIERSKAEMLNAGVILTHTSSLNEKDNCANVESIYKRALLCKNHLT